MVEPRIAVFGRRMDGMNERGRFMEFSAKTWLIIGDFWTSFAQNGVKILKITSNYVLR